METKALSTLGGLEQDPLKISFDLMGLRTVDWCEAGLNVHQTGLVWKGLKRHKIGGVRVEKINIYDVHVNTRHIIKLASISSNVFVLTSISTFNVFILIQITSIVLTCGLLTMITTIIISNGDIIGCIPISSGGI